MSGLTDKQLQGLIFMCRKTAEQGYPPSVRELTAEMGFQSLYASQRILGGLERKGYLVHSAGEPYYPTERAYNLVGRGVVREVCEPCRKEFEAALVMARDAIRPWKSYSKVEKRAYEKLCRLVGPPTGA